MFLAVLSRKMEVSVTHLSAIGYIPSYKPKSSKPLPKLLETAEDYEQMMEDISEFCKDCLVKKNGKVKPFSIALSDTSVAVKGRGSKNSTKKKDMQPAAPPNASEQREHELMSEIEKHHTWEHYQYTNNDLVIWATLVQQNLATVTKSEKCRDADSWRWAMETDADAAVDVHAPMDDASPSSGPHTSYRSEWLEGLDSDEDCGADSLNYQQYSGTFADIGVIRLDDLLEVETAEKLQELTKMNWGTAKRLIKFPKEDNQKLKKAQVE
ncbi:hypothetical protein B0H14DRAFT_3457013 [Mycena olivaceomarginata]|nr:hypothetical protein B0H14DRAFT_3457013 [Mycena olivaceomarginata]